MDRLFGAVEFDAVDGFAELENTGFYLDRESWLARCASDAAAKRIAEDKLHAAFEPISTQPGMFGGSQFNLDSTDFF